MPTHEPEVIEMMHFSPSPPALDQVDDRSIGTRVVPFPDHDRVREIGVTLEMEIRESTDAGSVADELFEEKLGY